VQRKKKRASAVDPPLKRMLRAAVGRWEVDCGIWKENLLKGLNVGRRSGLKIEQ
jgi:hypothetical protein